MTRKDKIKLLNHYEGNTCICGQKKRKKHWLCANCREKFGDTKESKDLDIACTAHTKAGYAYIQMIKRELNWDIVEAEKKRIE